MKWCWLMLAVLWLTGSTDAVNLVRYGENAPDKSVPLQNAGNGSTHEEVMFPVTYLGRKFNTVYIFADGYVSFGHPARIQHLGLPWTFPFKHSPEAEDPALLLPFFSRVLVSAGDKGRIWYRREDKYTAEGRDLLSSQNALVRLFLVGHADYSAHSVLVVTWSDLTFPGFRCLSSTGSCPPRNTFQLVLLTDGKSTVAILNYKSLNWLAGPRDGGSATSGSTQTHYPLAGFNAGLGHGWYPLPLSGSADVLGLSGYDRGAEPGQFIYSVAGETVRAGGCSSNSSLVDLKIHPAYGTFHGGNTMTLNGPCLSSEQSLKCKFRDRIVAGTMVNAMLVQCLVPFIGRLGWVDVSLSVDGGQSFPWSANYYLVKKEEVGLEKPESWLEVNPGELTITWNPRTLHPSRSTLVDVDLYGFNVTKEYQYIHLHKMARGVENSGRFTFKPTKSQCVDFLCADYVTGVLRVSVSGPDRVVTPFLWSGATSILWYSYAVNKQRYGDKWSHQKCDTWYREEMKDRKWLQQLPKCPCRLQQALADFRFRTQENCDMYGDGTCARHQGAKHCVLSELVTSFGAGSQCCYGDDDLLMHAYDSKFGSFAQRVSPLGALPYTIPLLPGVGHELLDIESYNLCCLWSTMTCDRYLAVRPTSQCYQYIPNTLAFIYGDPHFHTLGGTRYTFNGKGEFTLLQSPFYNTRIQGRFTQLVSDTGTPVAGTVLTGLVISSENASTVQITTNTPGYQWQRELVIYVDGRRVDFYYWNVRQEHNGCVITENRSPPGSLHSNYTLLYLHSGLGLRVATSSGFLHLTLSAPDNFRSTTSGLLGAWDDVTNMRSGRGDLVQMSQGGENIHKEFGLSWLVSEEDSMFTYLHGNDYKTYLDADFKPKYYPPSTRKRRSPSRGTLGGSPRNGARVSRRRRAAEEEIEGLCHRDEECRFDYEVTGDDRVAGETRVFGELARELVLSSKHTLFCPAFHIPYAIKSTRNYTVGQKLTITGCDIVNGEYTLTGSLDYACVQEAETAVWSPKVDAQCFPFPTQAVIIGTGGGILILILVAIIISAYFMYPKVRAIGERKPWRDLTERELRLQRRRSARMSRFMMKSRGSTTEESSAPTSPVPGAWDRLRNSIRRKSSAKPTARISPNHQLAPVPEDKEIPEDKGNENKSPGVKRENGFLPDSRPGTPTRQMSMDESVVSMFYDARSEAGTSYADCISDYPESLVSDDTFYDVIELTSSTSPLDFKRSDETKSPQRGRKSFFWPEAEDLPPPASRDPENDAHEHETII